jgi:Ca2+-binding EF-hand superfamily protein
MMIFRHALPLIALLACAQSGLAAQPSADQIQQAMASELPKRFARADVNHDQRLTREEAKGVMPRVYSHFDEIDTEKHGYVTEQDIVRAVNEQLLPRLERQGSSR